MDKKFKYKAIDIEGKTVRGMMNAENALELEYLLKESNMDMMSCRETIEYSFLKQRIESRDLISLFLHLEQLSKAGVPIIDAIDDTTQSSDNPSLKSLMQKVHESVRDGAMLSDAMSHFPNTFDSIFIGLIASSERSGKLDIAFSGIVEHLKWTSDMRRKTVKAIRYPLFSIVIAFVVIGVMTNVVVPKVTAFLTTQSLELPMSTIALIAFSDFTTHNAGKIIISIISTIILYNLGRKTFFKFKYVTDRIKLKIPIIGDLITKLDASRFCHFFSMTFSSGTAVLKCLSESKKIISNEVIRESLDNVHQDVSDGKTIAEAVDATHLFPTLVVRMFKVGEDSGNMKEALDTIQFFYNREINDTIEKAIGMIQPILTLIMGGMIGWITIAVFGPIYGSFSSFS